MNRKRSIAVAACLFAALAVNRPARAGTIVFDLNHEFSGGTQPSGSSPWLRAMFSDAAGGVELRMHAMLQGMTEFVRLWMFNLDPKLNPDLLSITHVSGEPLATAIGKGVNAFQADGNGLFDIQFTFATSGSDRFKKSDSVTYFISSPEPITALSFNFASHVSGGQGIFLSAAHVLGIDDELSGWIATPEPGTALLLLCSLGLVATRRRRFV